MNVGYSIPFFGLFDHAMELGVSVKNGSFLLTIIGITNILSRIIWGCIANSACINRLWLYNINLIVSGIGEKIVKIKINFIIKQKFNIYNFLSATISSVFCYNFETMATYSAVFGLTTAAYISLRAVILVDLLGVEKLNDAFGLLLWFEGIAMFLGTPIVGFLYNRIESYTLALLLAGLLSTSSGLMLFLMPKLQKKVMRNAIELEMTQR